MQDKVDALTTKKREQELRDGRNEEKMNERKRLDEKKRVAEENERKQALSHGQIVTDPKKNQKVRSARDSTKTKTCAAKEKNAQL